MGLRHKWRGLKIKPPSLKLLNLEPKQNLILIDSSLFENRTFQTLKGHQKETVFDKLRFKLLAGYSLGQFMSTMHTFACLAHRYHYQSISGRILTCFEKTLF